MKRNNLAVMFVGRIKGYKEIEDQLQYIKDTYNATFFVSLNKQTSSPYITTFCNKYSIIVHLTGGLGNRIYQIFTLNLVLGMLVTH
jgi:hypothetical protein